MFGTTANAYLKDRQTGQLLDDFLVDTNGAPVAELPTALSISDNGQYIGALSSKLSPSTVQDFFHIVDTSARQTYRPAVNLTSYGSADAPFSHVQVSPDGRYFILLSPYAQDAPLVVVVFDRVANGSFKFPLTKGSIVNGITSLVVSPDGSTVAIGGTINLSPNTDINGCWDTYSCRLSGASLTSCVMMSVGAGYHSRLGYPVTPYVVPPISAPADPPALVPLAAPSVQAPSGSSSPSAGNSSVPITSAPSAVAAPVSVGAPSVSAPTAPKAPTAVSTASSAFWPALLLVAASVFSLVVTL